MEVLLLTRVMTVRGTFCEIFHLSSTALLSNSLSQNIPFIPFLADILSTKKIECKTDLLGRALSHR